MMYEEFIHFTILFPEIILDFDETWWRKSTYG